MELSSRSKAATVMVMVIWAGAVAVIITDGAEAEDTIMVGDTIATTGGDLVGYFVEAASFGRPLHFGHGVHARRCLLIGEAGHAVVALAFCATGLHASIKRRGTSAGRVAHDPRPGADLLLGGSMNFAAY
jgi:hypothetical protein